MARRHLTAQFRTGLVATEGSLSAWGFAAALGSTPAGASLADTEAHEGALQGGLGAGLVDISFAAEELFGTGSGGFGTFEVDFVAALGGVGEDGDGVVADFQEAAADKERVFPTRFLHPQLAGYEGGDEWGMVGEDAELADGAGRDDGIDTSVLVEDLLAGDDFETQHLE